MGVPASKLPYLDIKDNTRMPQSRDSFSEILMDKIVEFVTGMADGMGLLTYDNPNYRYSQFSPSFWVKTTSPTGGNLADSNPHSRSSKYLCSFYHE